jgi:hypothetical protein
MIRAIRILLKTLAVSIAACIALVMLLYYVIVAVNWNDREPSALARQWRQRYDDRATLADAQNAYVFAMGFHVPEGQDPTKMGAQRIAREREVARRSASKPKGDDTAASSDSATDHPGATRDPIVENLREACRARGTGCISAFDNVDEAYDRWTAQERWLLPRYQQLLAFTGWVETAPHTELSLPLPAFQSIVDGQVVLLLTARRLSNQGDYRAAHDLLESDLRFWRLVLESSDTTVSKMIATSGLIRHFKLGNLILRGLDAPAAAKVMPAGWRAPLTDRERSMQRCMMGEWRFVSGLAESLNPIFRYELAVNAEDERPKFGRTVVALLGAPLYQTQDSINQYAEHYSQVVELLDVSLDRYAGSRAQSAELARAIEAAGWPPQSLYNIVGSWMVAQGTFDYFDYGARVADIEGVRRAALTAATLRAANVRVEGVQQALINSDLKNPYDGQPFEWAAPEGAIRFRGLQHGERGEHLLHYQRQ